MTDAPDATAANGAAARKEPGPHGSYRRYYSGPDVNGNPGRCSCPLCRAAVSTWQRNRTRLQAYGRWEPFTDAAPVREHVRKLSVQGMGLRATAKASGVPFATVTNLMYGSRGKPPTGLMRPENARRLLAVRLSPDLLAPGTRVGATGTHRRLQALVAAGHALSVLAGRLGMTLANLGTVMRSDRVTASTARAVKALYGEMWDAVPDVSTPRGARLAASARRMATARGWPPAAAWDDDAIDDPAGCPAEGWQRGSQWTSAGLAEDAAELTARGYTREDIAERLEVKRDTLDAAIARAGRRAGAQATASADTTGERSDAAA